ncbi:TetR/AcrR family transcriptional regulator [Secundilactobacillus paracollinoides]|uniref:HTH tetR-type domain-containing protein n=1 Tax=Secundilactobacillus paracollinoides TaxID=240427 RepID=A0A1B2IUK4_9LACO|nr:TetR/AcrR family transcriptional regulator [Secundilactobacillus paracollinoides]ANZ59930.1 hypothetical protein AYR61_00205 [Secundilactobacillus paracollinoides]ANZ65721.1 hypothetical protein AYR63_00210 [Secundilactobacillus paracollinoides]
MDHTGVKTLFDANIDNSSLSIKQQSVLKASLILFAEKGYENTSTQDIAKLAGCAEGTVFKHFKTKDALLKAVLDPFVNDILPQVIFDFLKDLSGQPEEHFSVLLRYAVRDRIKYIMENRQEMRIFIQEIVKNPSMLEGLTSRLVLVIETSVNQVFSCYQARGELVDWDAMRIIRTISGVLLGYLIPNIVMSNKPLDVETTTNEIVEFLLQGLVPEGARDEAAETD